MSIFDSQLDITGDLRHITKLKPWPLYQVLTEKYEWDHLTAKVRAGMNTLTGFAYFTQKLAGFCRLFASHAGLRPFSEELSRGMPSSSFLSWSLSPLQLWMFANQISRIAIRVCLAEVMQNVGAKSAYNCFENHFLSFANLEQFSNKQNPHTICVVICLFSSWVLVHKMFCCLPSDSFSPYVNILLVLLSGSFSRKTGALLSLLV